MVEEKEYIINPYTIALTCFCERDGPNIVFTTQKIHPNSEIYTFPPSFHKSRKNIIKIMKQLPLEDNIHFFFTPPTSETNSPNSPQYSPIKESSKTSTSIPITISTPSDPENGKHIIYLLLNI